MCLFGRLGPSLPEVHVLRLAGDSEPRLVYWASFLTWLAKLWSFPPLQAMFRVCTFFSWILPHLIPSDLWDGLLEIKTCWSVYPAPPSNSQSHVPHHHRSPRSFGTIETLGFSAPSRKCALTLLQTPKTLDHSGHEMFGEPHAGRSNPSFCFGVILPAVLVVFKVLASACAMTFSSPS